MAPRTRRDAVTPGLSFQKRPFSWRSTFRRYRFLAVAFALIGGSATRGAMAAVEIQWWHALTGANNLAVLDLARRFNDFQNEFEVVPTYKGSYPDAMQAGLDAFRAGSPPHILQVVEVGTATMMSATGMIKPMHELMRDARQPFDPKVYLPAIIGYYSTASGEMLSFPFNSSSAVTWVNLDALTRAGLADASLATWPRVFEAARRLRAGSPTCGMSTAWFSWLMLEQFSAWHDIPFATKVNGMLGFDAELKFNSPLQGRHLASLVELQKDKSFDYSGRADSGEQRFLDGECPILLSSSGFFGLARSKANFKFEARPMPYYDDVPNAPQNSLIGGASLWVFRGKTPYEYRGVAMFFSFLSETNRQAELHQRLGYLPATRSAYETTRSSGFYRDTTSLETPLLELIGKPATDNSRGVRLGDMVRIRDIIGEETEKALSGVKSAQQSLDASVERGNALLRDFERSVH
jgi:sn-glycerol 3-phosphate transport system substrate-binding protein